VRLPLSNAQPFDFRCCLPVVPSAPQVRPPAAPLLRYGRRRRGAGAGGAPRHPRRRGGLRAVRQVLLQHLHQHQRGEPGAGDACGAVTPDDGGRRQGEPGGQARDLLRLLRPAGVE
jgi:hypothetical protein